MGIDYGFQIYVHRRDAGRLLTMVAALCERDERDERDERTVVALPDGTSMVLPCTYGFTAGRVLALTDVVASRGGSAFDLAFHFPQDGPLLGYQNDETHRVPVVRAWPDGTTRVRVGHGLRSNTSIHTANSTAWM